MEDEHFLSQLVRVNTAQQSLALSLYRDAELLRLILAECSLADEATRVAISLEHEVYGPFIIVTRDGKFVTSLGPGMKADNLPIITRQKLDSVCSKTEDLRRRFKASQELSSKEGDKKLMLRLFEDADKLSREEFLANTAWAPFLAERYAELYIQSQRTVRLFRDKLLRLKNEKYLDPEQASVGWKTLYSTGHLGLLMAMSGLRPWIERMLEKGRDPSGVLSFHPFTTGVISLMLRGYWSVNRIGKALVPAYKEKLTKATMQGSVIDSVLGLASLALGHQKLEAEIKKFLQRFVNKNPEEKGFEAVRSAYAAWGIRLIESQEVLLKVHRQVGAKRAHTLSLNFPEGSPHRFSSPEEVPDTLAYPCLVNLHGDLLNPDHKSLQIAVTCLPWVVRAQPEDLYLPGDFLRGTSRPWELGDVLALRERWLKDFGKEEPVRVEPQPGRNELCRCGSGKKFKRCCGA